MPGGYGLAFPSWLVVIHNTYNGGGGLLLNSAPCMVGVSLYVLRGVHCLGPHCLGLHCVMPHYMGGGGGGLLHGQYCMEVTMEPPCMVPHCTVGGGSSMVPTCMVGGGGFTV